MSQDLALRIPSRVRPMESDRVLDRALELVRDYRSELATIRQDQDERLNSIPGSGLFALNASLGIQGQGGQFQDQSSLPGTLSLANSYFPITNNWTLLSYSYMSQGLLRKVVDQVVDDAFGDGVNFESDQLDDEELKDLNDMFKEARDPDSYLGTKGQKINLNAGYDLTNSDMEACRQVGKWGRLYGGAGMIVNTTQQMNKQLNPDAIAQDAPLTFIAADRWELTLTTYNSNDFGSTTPYEYYGNALHRSRVSRFVWAQAPARIRRLLNGWGMSVLEDSIAPVSAYLKLRKLIFELIDEAKVDVYKIKGFNSQLISAKGTQQLMARIQASNQTKNFQNAITMDVDDDYEQKNLGAIFPGIASLQEQSRIDLCAYLNIPYNKVFGQSSGGFSSGKDALDNYNSTVRNFRTNITAVIKKAGQLRCQQLHGMIPDDLGVEWIPLAVLDGVETEAVKTSQQNRITQRFQLGLTTAQEAMQEMRKNDLCDCDETEVELGLRDAEPPLSENPDEAQANRDHETDMAASAAKDKKKAATK